MACSVYSKAPFTFPPSVFHVNITLKILQSLF